MTYELWKNTINNTFESGGTIESAIDEIFSMTSDNPYIKELPKFFMKKIIGIFIKGFANSLGFYPLNNIEDYY